jgi:hypothetical protein
MSIRTQCAPQVSRHGDPSLKDYFPAWVNNMADDATVEGSMLNGVVAGRGRRPVSRAHHPLDV